MKKINSFLLTDSNSFIIKKQVKDILAGDKLLIFDETIYFSFVPNYNCYKLIDVPENGITKTKNNQVLIEYNNPGAIVFVDLPIYSYVYLGGLISFSSLETKSYVKLYGKINSDYVGLFGHLFKDQESSVDVLYNSEKLYEKIKNLNSRHYDDGIELTKPIRQHRRIY